MKRSWGSGLLLCLGLFLGGCGPTMYQRVGALGGGFADKPEATAGAYQIDFLAQGRTFKFVQNAAFYRAAEVTYNNQYRYFTVLKLDDSSSYARSPNMGLGSETNYTFPGVTLHIQCYTQRPAAACYDAYQYLDTVKFPLTEAPYTVLQRQGDKAAGKYNQ